MSIKSKLWFILRWLIWIKDNLIDNPKINKSIKSFSIWKTLLWDEIKCYKFWIWTEKVLYLWWLHWNEVWTVKLMNKWVNYLNKNERYKNKQVFVIPCLNVDWYNKALKNTDYLNGWTIWKTNANNIDLNRNFPTLNWSEKAKLFVAWKYSDISGWEKPWSELEIQVLLKFLEKEQIKTMYVYHNCWGTVMGTFTKSSDKKVRTYSKSSWYKIFTKEDWNNLKDEQKTWHWTMWGIENNIDFIEVELKTRWWSEWNKNRKALINSI
jgi:hypothetical protein